MAPYTADKSLPKINPAAYKKNAAASYDVKKFCWFPFFFFGFGASDKMPLIHCAKEDLELQRNTSATYNTPNKPNLVQVCHYLLTIWRHRMCAAKRRGLGCQMLYMTITKL